MTNKERFLQPIKAKSLTDRVEESLMEYFKNNDFTPGQALPKETELAEALGVSRNIIREALSRLKMLGIVESRKRKGMILSKPDILSGLSRMLDPNLLGEESLKNIFELRLVLEVGMGDLIYARKKASDIDELMDIASREAEDPTCQDSQQVRSAYEIEFHGKLYQMTGNDTLTRFQSMLLPVFNYMMEVESSLQKEPSRGNVSHFDLIETIKNGNPAKFRESMRNHLTPHYERL